MNIHCVALTSLAIGPFYHGLTKVKYSQAKYYSTRLATSVVVALVLTCILHLCKNRLAVQGINRIPWIHSLAHFMYWYLEDK